MSERMEEIRRYREQERMSPLSGGRLWGAEDVDILLAALAQAERERDIAKARPACVDCEYVESGGVFPCVRHQGPEHGLAGFWLGNTDWDDTWEHWKRRCLQAEADLARVRAALDREHICVMEACCNDAVRAALEGRG